MYEYPLLVISTGLASMHTEVKPRRKGGRQEICGKRAHKHYEARMPWIRRDLDGPTIHSVQPSHFTVPSCPRELPLRQWTAPGKKPGRLSPPGCEDTKVDHQIGQHHNNCRRGQRNKRWHSMRCLH